MYERACKCPPGHPLFHSSDASCCLPDSKPLSGLGRVVSVPAKDPGKYWTVEKGLRNAQMQRLADTQPGIKASDVGAVMSQAQYRGSFGLRAAANTVPSDRALYVTRQPALGATGDQVSWDAATGRLADGRGAPVTGGLQRLAIAPLPTVRSLPQPGMPSCGAPVNGQCAGDCYYYCPTNSCVPNMISTPPILPGQCEKPGFVTPPVTPTRNPWYNRTQFCAFNGTCVPAAVVYGGAVALLAALGAGIYFATRDA